MSALPPKADIKNTQKLSTHLHTDGVATLIYAQPKRISVEAFSRHPQSVFLEAKGANSGAKSRAGRKRLLENAGNLRLSKQDKGRGGG